MVVGISACGLAPFVRGAMERAREVGAATIFVTCAPEARKLLRADVVINPVVGAEVVAGSTRMKAGTATKLVLNTLTTAAMIRCGKVYGNLMVDVRAGSEKLRDRAERIVMAVTGVARPRARRLLKEARGRAKVAIVMQARKVGFDAAAKLLKQAGGSLRSRAWRTDAEMIRRPTAASQRRRVQRRWTCRWIFWSSASRWPSWA